MIDSLCSRETSSKFGVSSKKSPSGQTTFDVSIIIATKNRARLLDAMLSSLKKAADEVNYEVIVIEGGSSDNTLEILRSHGIAQIYDEAGQLGKGRHSWSQLYNFGFSKAKGKWAMFASDDITFSEGCISQAVGLLNKQADDVAGGIFFYKNVFAEPGWDDFGIDYTYGQKLLLNYGLVRLDLFRDSRGLDDLYDFYCADGDLCLKLYEQGRQFIPLPHCFVTHNNVADVQKQVNVQAAQKDIDRYTARWKHFVSTSYRTGPAPAHVAGIFRKDCAGGCSVRNRQGVNLPLRESECDGPIARIRPLERRSAAPPSPGLRRTVPRRLRQHRLSPVRAYCHED